MEDWWLVRDSKGDTGWLYSRMMDVDAPDAITRYAEGQRIVGAYVLTKVYDPEAEQEDKNIPIYVTVMSPYKAGLPYDFDQVRVFTWSVKKHRYETGFRDKNIEGYLPVTIKTATDPYGKSASRNDARANLQLQGARRRRRPGHPRSGDRSDRPGQDHPEDLSARRQSSPACRSHPERQQAAKPIPSQPRKRKKSKQAQGRETEDAVSC